jgi:hypothetical protein
MSKRCWVSLGKFPTFLLLIRSWVLIYCSSFGINLDVVVLDVG